MTDEPTIAKSLDLSGLLCPLRVVKVSKAIKDIEIGEAIEATATDPGVLLDIPAWCKGSGNEMVTMDKEGSAFRFVIRRVN